MCFAFRIASRMAGKIWTPLLRSVAVPPNRTGEPARSRDGQEEVGRFHWRHVGDPERRRPAPPGAEEVQGDAEQGHDADERKDPEEHATRSVGCYGRRKSVPHTSVPPRWPATRDERRGAEERGPIGDADATRPVMGADREHGRSDRAHGARGPIHPCHASRREGSTRWLEASLHPATAVRAPIAAPARTLATAMARQSARPV